jgi:hypothetical protein
MLVEVRAKRGRCFGGEYRIVDTYCGDGRHLPTAFP